MKLSLTWLKQERDKQLFEEILVIANTIIDCLNISLSVLEVWLNDRAIVY